MQRDRPTAKLLPAEPSSNTLGEGQEHRFDRRGVERIAIEGVRMPDRLGRPAVADDLALVDTVRALPDVSPVLSQARFHHARVHRREVPDRPETPALEHLARLRADAPETSELERREE